MERLDTPELATLDSQSSGPQGWSEFQRGSKYPIFLVSRSKDPTTLGVFWGPDRVFTCLVYGLSD